MRVRSFGYDLFVEEAVDAHGSQLRARGDVWCQQCGAVLGHQQHGCNCVCGPHGCGSTDVQVSTPFAMRLAPLSGPGSSAA